MAMAMFFSYSGSTGPDQWGSLSLPNAPAEDHSLQSVLLQSGQSDPIIAKVKCILETIHKTCFVWL